MKPEFDTLDDTTGFEVVDPIETRRFTFSTPNEVELQPANPDSFQFPVSSACAVETGSLTIKHPMLTYVRNEEGEQIADLDHHASAEFTPRNYLLELNTPVKLYLRFDAGVRINSDAVTMRIDLDRETSIEVGARSFHSSPQATIRTTSDPEDVMAAISAFGSALKTTSCERSWPTLRGHPPRIERGDELEIPDEVVVPDTGVTVEIPPEYDAIYPVVPLAHYFAAEVVPGKTARMTVGDFEHCFDADDSFEEQVERLLKQTFSSIA